MVCIKGDIMFWGCVVIDVGDTVPFGRPNSRHFIRRKEGARLPGILLRKNEEELGLPLKLSTNSISHKKEAMSFRGSD